MNKTLIAKVEGIFERPWNELALATKAMKLAYEAKLNSNSRKERMESIGMQDGIEKGRVRLFYTTNTNAQGGISNGGGRGWYVSGPVGPGMMFRSDCILND